MPHYGASKHLLGENQLKLCSWQVALSIMMSIFRTKRSSASSHSEGRASGDYLGPQNSCLKDTPTIWISFATAATATTTSTSAVTTTAAAATSGAFFCLNSFQWTPRVPATIWRPPSSQVFVKHMTLKKILKYGPEKKLSRVQKTFPAYWARNLVATVASLLRQSLPELFRKNWPMKMLL